MLARFLRTLLTLAIALAATPARADVAPPANPVWQRPTLVPIPAGAATLPLTWNANTATTAIPADLAGKRLVLRFEAAGNGAKLSVNDQFVRDHWGPNLPWSADITDKIKPGAANTITIELDQRRDGVGQFIRGGGNGDAILMVLPRDYIARVHAETTFDKSYKDATLHIWLTVNFHGGTTAKVQLALKDPTGKPLPLGTVELTPQTADRIFDFPVPNAIKWDAEHPNLYTLETTLLDDKNLPLETLTKSIGLRQVEVKANQMFVNGQEVKFRGIWSGGVQQIKNWNGNHTRQKWANERYFEDADRLGLYVLDENPVDFAKYGAESDPQFLHQWMGFITDMIEYDRDHPSIIMWGLGNESWTGPSILKMFQYSKIEDTQRPVIFSFGNRVPPDQELPFSIFSAHYPNLGDPTLDLSDFVVAKWQAQSLLQQRTPRPVMPVLVDESNHICQNAALKARDPNVRNFWGESLSRSWEKMFTTKGSLGLDIFGVTGGFDATNTELSLIAKAFTPIRIANQPLPNPGPGKPLPVPVKNWFDHTNLNELTFNWSVGTESGTLTGDAITSVPPHASGNLHLPARAWKDGDQVNLKILRNNTPIAEFLLAVNPPKPALPASQGPAPKLETRGTKVVISGDHFQVTFDKFRGLLENASFDGKTVISEGPFLNLLGSGISYKEWWVDDFKARIDGNEALISIRGNFAVINVSFEIRIDGTGLISTRYTIDNVPGNGPPSTFSPWNATSEGGYSEVGISYMLPSAVSTLSWKRQGYFSVYPANHMGRLEGSIQNATFAGGGGTAGRGGRGGAPAGAAGGGGEEIATKENVLSATLADAAGSGITALSDGRDAVRCFADSPEGMTRGIRLCINNQWNYPDIGIGNWCKPPIMVKNGYSNTVFLKLGAK